MLHQLRNRNFYLMVSGDMVLFVMAHAGAYLIRFDFKLTAGILNQILSLLPVLVPVKTVTFLSLGLYRGMWRYSSLSDVWKLLKATILSSLVIVSVILFLQHFHGYSRGVFVIDAGLTFLFTGSLRIAVRLLYHEGFLKKTKRPDIASRSRSNGKPVILVGAGDAGEKTFRELADNPSLKYRVVGFVDDDQRKKGRLIHGVPVRGTVAECPALLPNSEPRKSSLPSQARQDLR